VSLTGININASYGFISALAATPHTPFSNITGKVTLGNLAPHSFSH